MDFEKSRLEELKEEILSIEDFEKVDEGLMSEIGKNEELCRLFEEMKALSALVGDSAPSPMKDGVTLHDAVMKRIECGDTAPRYIYKRKYPIATAACLLVCMAVVLVSRVGFGGFAEKAEFDAASPETEMLSDGENGVAAAGYKPELFTLDEAADEELFAVADSVKFKSATITADNAEFQAAPTQEAVPELYSAEAEDTEVYSDTSAKGGSAVSFTKAYNGATSNGMSVQSDDRAMFLVDGNRYSVSEIFELYKNRELDFDINSDDFDEVWRACLEAVSEDDDAELVAFIKDNYEKSLK